MKIDEGGNEHRVGGREGGREGGKEGGGEGGREGGREGTERPQLNQGATSETGETMAVQPTHCPVVGEIMEVNTRT